MMGQPLQAKAMLVVRQGTQAGMSFQLMGRRAVLGREESSDIVIQDPEASRRHAQVGWQGGQFVLEDLGSTNGTYVNGIQITTPQVLNPGDSIGIGQTALVFQMAGAQMGQFAPAYQNSPPMAYPGNQYAGNTMYAQNMPPEEDYTLQYILYGFGCMLLVGICFLSALIALVLLEPSLFGLI